MYWLKSSALNIPSYAQEELDKEVNWKQSNASRCITIDKYDTLDLFILLNLCQVILFQCQGFDALLIWVD